MKPDQFSRVFTPVLLELDYYSTSSLQKMSDFWRKPAQHGQKSGHQFKEDEVEKFHFSKVANPQDF